MPEKEPKSENNNIALLDDLETKIKSEPKPVDGWEKEFKQAIEWQVMFQQELEALRKYNADNIYYDNKWITEHIKSLKNNFEAYKELSENYKQALKDADNEKIGDYMKKMDELFDLQINGIKSTLKHLEGKEVHKPPLSSDRPNTI
jgi:molecular chaperone GrpE (heat shock protein)